MARDFGRVRARRGGKNGWEIDLGRGITPRFLYSARGARFESEKMAQAILDAIRVRIARGAAPQQSVDEFAPSSSDRNRVSTWVERYIAEQEERTATLEISPNHLRELHRCARPDGTWCWWASASIHEIDAASLNEWRLWLATNRGLSPKSVRNTLGYFRAFVGWLFRLERIDRVPAFPLVKVRDHQPTILSRPTQDLILETIPWERRGAFLAARHGIRPGELRALDVGDFQPRDAVPGLNISRAVKGPNANAPTGGTKTGDAHWIPIDEDLEGWISWRLEQRAHAAVRPAAKAAAVAWRSTALFPNPTSRNSNRRWIANSLREEWNTAAATVGITVRMYEGTKHSAATGWRTSGMSLEMIQRMLRHRDSRSTERYAKLTDQALVVAFGKARRR
jgi:integrase